MAWKKRAAGNGETVRYTTLKVRLYPTKAQADLFENTFGCCRYIWNRMLADEQRFYLETDQHFIPTPAKYKKEAPFLKEVDNQALITGAQQAGPGVPNVLQSPGDLWAPQFQAQKGR